MKCLKFMKRRINSLSAKTHINPEHHGKYLGEEHEKVFVSYLIPELIKESLHYLLILTDLYRVVSEFVSWDFFPKKVACEKDKKGKVHFIEGRPMASLIAEFQSKNLERK